MSRILLKDDAAMLVQDHHFDGGGTDIDSDPQVVVHNRCSLSAAQMIKKAGLILYYNISAESLRLYN